MQKKLIAIMAMLLAAVFALSACQTPTETPSGDDTTVADTTLADTTTDGGNNEDAPLEFESFDDLQNMKIIISDSCDKRIFDAQSELFMYLMSEKEITLQKGTDGSKKGDPAPEGTAEILIGDTNRPESSGKTYTYGDFSVSYENGRIVINGGSVPAILNGVEWFKENCLGETLQRPKGTYTHIHEYTMTNVKLYGELLSNYRVESNDFDKEAQYLNEYIAMNVGSVNENAEKVITLKNDTETTPSSSAMVKQVYGGMQISVCGKTADIEKAVQLFKDALENRTSDELNIEKTQKLDLGEGIESLSKLQVNEWRKETDEKISSIRNSANMSLSGKTVYYVSNNGNDNNDGKSPSTAWATLNRVNNANLQSGNVVCFERGGTWRGQLTAKTGVTYTAYGTGAKPNIYRSERNVGGEENWENVSGNIWRLKNFNEKNTSRTQSGWYDVGTLVFNEGKDGCAIKVLKTTDGTNIDKVSGKKFETYKDLSQDLQFYHANLGYEGEDGYLYMYSSTGNPGKRFKSIELNQRGNIISVGGNKNVTIDNLCLKYTGSHGVGASTTSGLTVTNCEIGWIGGSILDQYFDGRNHGTRYGNGVEIYGGCDGYTVKNNYIYQVYDAGITQQYSTDSASLSCSQKNIQYVGNVIENAYWSIEYWLDIPSTSKSVIENLTIENNYLWYAGEGPLCSQRPDSGQSAHIMTWHHLNPGSDVTVKNNLFYGSESDLMRVYSSESSLPKFIGNDFVQKDGAGFGWVSSVDRTGRKFNTDIVKYMDKQSLNNTYWFFDWNK